MIEDGFALWVETWSMEVPSCAGTERFVSNEMWVSQPYTYPGQWIEAGNSSETFSEGACSSAYRFYGWKRSGESLMYIGPLGTLPRGLQVGYIIEDYNENDEWEIWLNEEGRPNTWWRPQVLRMPFLYGSVGEIGMEAATEIKPINYALYAPWSEFYHSWENWRHPERVKVPEGNPFLCFAQAGAHRPAEVSISTC